MILKFGKYKGERFQDTPVSYQQWLMNQEWFKKPKWGVYYMPTKEGRIFARIKPELVAKCNTKEEAFEMCEHYNQCGVLDELHSGYNIQAVYH